MRSGPEPTAPAGLPAGAGAAGMRRLPL
ncbi:hypothetical protein DD556_17800 [Phaeobacter sp. JL2872]|nr:hypothetical protein DD556_17800 [Phaeobacter sp. JL2872]